MTVASRHWATDVPSRLRTIPLSGRRTFLEDLGRQAAELVYLPKGKGTRGRESPATLSAE